MAVDPLMGTGAASSAAAKYAAANSSGNSSSSSSAADDAKTASLNYDSFLKLLVEQLKNQDPTDPMDTSEQMSQLASFSNVEQSIKMNSHLESLIQQTNLTSAASWIGKNITSADGKTSGTVSSVDITSDGITATLTSGKTVTIETGITLSGTTSSSGK